MDGSGTVNGIIDFGGGTAAAAGTTMNQNDTITGTSAISGDLLKVSLQNAGGAIGGGTAATAQVNKITVPTVTADQAQVTRYVFNSSESGATVSFTYGSNNGSFAYSATVAGTSATNFEAALDAVAGANIASITTVAGASTAVSDTLLMTVTTAMAAGIRAGQSVTGTNVAAETFVASISGTVVTLSVKTSDTVSGTATFGANEVTVTAPTAGVATPSIAFGNAAVVSQVLVTPNISGNQGDVVTFTYNGLSGSYVIGSSNDATASNLKDALTATIPTAQAVAAVTDSGTSDFVTLTSAVAGVPLSNLTFSAAAGNVPTTTTTTANQTATGGISFGNNSGLDALYVNNISGQAATITQASVASATQLWADRSTGALEFTGVGKTTTIGINGSGTATQLGAVTASFVAETAAANVVIQGGARAGSLAINQADTNLKTVNISSVTGAQTSSAGQINTLGAITLGANATAVNINATTSLTTGGVTTAAGLRTINVSGAATTVDLGAILAAVTTVNGSGLTAGGIKASLSTSAATAFSFTGGAGSDEVTVAGAFSNVITGVNGGSGTTDRVVLTTAAMTTATGSKFSNFEILENDVASSIQDATVISGITSVVLDAASAGFSKLTAEQAGNVTFRGGVGTAATLSLGTATGTTDSLAITMQHASAANVATVINPGSLTVNGFESMSVAVNAGVTSIYASGKSGATVQNTSQFAFASSGATSLTSLTVSGAYAATVDIAEAKALTSVSAANNTGGLVITTGGNTGALTVTGSATAANLYNLAAVGTGGTLTVNGGASTDFFSGDQAVVALATIAGGTGTDTLNLTDTASKTFLDTDYKNVTGVERFTFGTTDGDSSLIVGSNLTRLANANNGALFLSATALTTGTITFDASTLAGSSLTATVTAALGSATNNNDDLTRIFTSETGADLITLTTSVTGSGTIGSFLVDGQENTSSGITINAAGMTGALSATSQKVSVVSLIGGSGADTITVGTVGTSVTGGAGSDTITLGSGAGVDAVIYRTKATSIGQNNVDTVNVFTVANDNIILSSGGNGALLTGITLTATASAGDTTGTATSTTSVDTIAQVYAAIESNAAFAASAFAASAAGAGGLENTIITFSSGAAQGTYLVINDGIAGFQGSGDLVVKLVGTSGTFAGANIDVV